MLNRMMSQDGCPVEELVYDGDQEWMPDFDQQYEP